jgi:HEAT repeat protein
VAFARRTGRRSWLTRGTLFALLVTLAAARPLTAQTTPAASAPASAPLDPAAVLQSTNATQPQRDEAAQRLVQRQTPDAKRALAAALADAGNRPAQLAVARAVLFDPNPDPAFVLPLFDLINTQRPDLVDAGITALTVYRDRDASDVRRRLIDIALDSQHQQRPTTRLSAIKAVGTMANRLAAGALVSLLASDAEPPAIRDAAATALADMTGSANVVRDPGQWQRWFDANQADPNFERNLLAARSARVTVLQQRMDRVVADVQARLGGLYQTIPDTAKEKVLLDYLRAAEPEIRMVGAQLVQDDFKNTRPVPASVRAQLRTMVGDSSSRVRVAVAKTLYALNEPQAIDELLAQLGREQDTDVKIELIRTMVPMRDLRVVDRLVAMLRDPSPAVAEVTAGGLADKDLAPLIQKNPELSRRIARELRAVLDARRNEPGTVPLRAALVDAMGAMKDPSLRDAYAALVRRGEPQPVRLAALRALGQLGRPGGQTWPADIVVDALSDPDDAIRLEAIRALRTTADFSHAERLYEQLKSQTNSAALREEAWGVLRNIFAEADKQRLQFWADRRFRDEPERRVEILKVLAERLIKDKDLPQLALVQQNIGEDLMKLSAAAAGGGDADAARKDAGLANQYFANALEFYRSQNKSDQDMVTSGLIEKRMEAFLATADYKEAAAFAATCIANYPSNQDLVGPKLRNEVDRLRNEHRAADALKLIDAIDDMNPPLAAKFSDFIHQIEQELRSSNSAPVPRSAIGNIQDTPGNGQ